MALFVCSLGDHERSRRASKRWSIRSMWHPRRSKPQDMTTFTSAQVTWSPQHVSRTRGSRHRRKACVEHKTSCTAPNLLLSCDICKHSDHLQHQLLALQARYYHLTKTYTGGRPLKQDQHHQDAFHQDLGWCLHRPRGPEVSPPNPAPRLSPSSIH